MEMGSVLALVLLFAGIVLLFKTVRVVPQGYEWTVERFGKYTHTMQPGLHFLVPVIYGVGRKINVMEQVLDVPSQDVITKDNAVVKVDGVVFFHVLDAAKAAYEVHNLELATIALVQTNIRTVIGSMDLDESLSNREAINAQLLGVVDQATNPWGIKVNRIEIRDIQPPRDLVDSMARQMKAERDRRAVILEAEGHRQSEILRAEGEKQAAILEAEGEKEAAYREAEARERLEMPVRSVQVERVGGDGLESARRAQVRGFPDEVVVGVGGDVGGEPPGEGRMPAPEVAVGLHVGELAGEALRDRSEHRGGEVGVDDLLDPGSLDLDHHERTGRALGVLDAELGAVGLANGGRGDGLGLEDREALLQGNAELSLDHRADVFVGFGPDLVLQPGELRGDLTGQHVQPCGEELPDLVLNRCNSFITKFILPSFIFMHPKSFDHWIF